MQTGSFDAADRVGGLPGKTHDDKVFVGRREQRLLTEYRRNRNGAIRKEGRVEFDENTQQTARR